MKTYRPYEPRQSYLLPPSPLEWLPDGHLAYFVMDTVGELGIAPITAWHERDPLGRGQPGHHPRMMLSLLVYGYCIGERSSRQIERKTYEDVAFRVIAGGQHPDHTRISEFRRIHLGVLPQLFVQVLRLCQRAGLVKLGKVALDGTKMKANASKHKAMSYQRMQEDEARLKAKVEELLQAAEDVDAEEDALYGKGCTGDEVPEELKRAETRRARIRALKAELEAEAKAQADAKAKKDDDDPPPPSARAELPSHKIPTDKDGTPTPKAQRNFTDAESRIMKGADGYVQGYNCQVVVDAAHQVIVAQAVTNQPPDVEHMPAMLEQTIANCRRRPACILADSGYYSEQNAEHAAKRGVDAYLATGRRKHNEPPPTVRGRPPADLTPKQLMARKLATQKGAAIYARRKVIVEPVFGFIKAARGIRDFLLRGLAKVRGEWSLIALTHNLLKLHVAAQAA